MQQTALSRTHTSLTLTLAITITFQNVTSSLDIIHLFPKFREDPPVIFFSYAVHKH